MTDPLVWVGAAAVAYGAGVTSDVETDTRGLGDAIFGTASWWATALLEDDQTVVAAADGLDR